MEPASDSGSDSDSSISAAGNIPERRNDDVVPQSRRNRHIMTHHHEYDDDEHGDSDSSSMPSSSSEDDDDNASDGGSSSSAESGESDDEEPADDTDLQSRLQNRKSGDATFGTSAVSSLRRKKAGRKEAALSLASERLAAFRKEKKQRKQQKKSRGAYDSDSDESVDGEGSKRNMDKTAKATTKKKKSKHAPTEASSRRSDFYRRGAPQLNSSGIGVEVGANRYRARDPRLEGMSGHYDEEVFEKRYAFLDDMRQEEMAKLTKRIAARKATGRSGQKMRRKLGLTGEGGGTLEDDEAELARLKQDRADRKRSQTQRSAKRAVKKRIRDEIADGKRGAYHVSRSELKRMELEAKFDEIRKRGGNAAVEKELAKKRKKQESKSKRYLPSR